MRQNPELQRNLWLELSPYRLVSMPLILSAVLYLAYVSDDYTFGTTVASASIGLFFVVSLIWGTKLASETIMNEIRDHTWDGQRMSVLTPWELTIGKLFGSTVYSWYGALFCLGAYWLAAVAGDPKRATMTALALLLTGLLAHSISLLASLMALQKERRYNRSQTAGLLLFGIFSAGPFFSMVLGRSSTVTWYGMTFASLDFLLLSLAAYAAWGVTGVSRLMRLELQMRNLPWSWYGFVLFLMVHLAGFFHGEGHGDHLWTLASPAPLAAYFIALGSVYFMAFIERKDFLTLRGLLRLAEAGSSRRLLERTPRWLLTIPLVALAGLSLLLTATSGTEGGIFSLAAYVIASLLFLLRDLGIMVFCNLGRNTRRADILAFICLVLLHGVFPAIFTVMKAEPATLLFWPRTDIMPALGSTFALLELVLVAWLVTLRWRQRVVEGG